MIKTDKLQLLPNQYFVGLTLHKSKILSKANLTKYQAGVFNASCKNEIEIIYSINARSASKPDLNKEEIHFLLIPVNDIEYKAKALKIISSALQRGIPYTLILIFNYGDQYRIVMPEYRLSKKKKDVCLVENLYINGWMSLEELRTYFSFLSDNLLSDKFMINDIINYFENHLMKYDLYKDFEEVKNENTDFENAVEGLMEIFGIEKLHEMINFVDYYSENDNDEFDGILRQIYKELDYVNYEIDKYEYIDNLRSVLSKYSLQDFSNEIDWITADSEEEIYEYEEVK